MIKEDNAVLIEIGKAKYSESWTNIYLKFRFESNQEVWLYYSEHVNKPTRLKQIDDFVKGTIAIEDRMTITYKIIQSPNKSTKLSIVDIANHNSKK